MEYECTEDPRQECAWHLASLPDGKPAVLNFSNKGYYDVDLYWLNFEGNEQLVRGLDRGESCRQATSEMHAWIIRDRNSGTAIQLEAAEEAGDSGGVNVEIRVVADTHCREPFVAFQVTNDTPVAVDLFVENTANQAPSFQHLAPAQSYQISGPAGTSFYACLEGTSDPIWAYALNEQAHHQHSSIRLDSYLGRPATLLTIRNTTPAWVTLSWRIPEPNTTFNQYWGLATGETY